MAAICVLNTRPKDRAAPLTHALMMAGFKVVELPLLDYTPCVLPPEQAGWALQMDWPDCIFVASPEAARLGIDFLHQYLEPALVDAAKRCTWVAVGQATAAVLARDNIMAHVPAQEASEGVLALPVMQHLQAGQRVLIWRGQGGRALLPDDLQARSVYMRIIEWYVRGMPLDTKVNGPRILHEAAPDIVLLSSAESYQYWQRLAPCLIKTPIFLVRGQTLADELIAQGQRVVNLASLQPQDIIRILQQIHLITES